MINPVMKKHVKGLIFSIVAINHSRPKDIDLLHFFDLRFDSGMCRTSLRKTKNVPTNSCDEAKK